MSDRMNTQQALRRLSLSLASLIILLALAGPCTAQSSDPNAPTPMTSDTVQGRWPKARSFSHFYSFTAGPGTVKVLFYFKPSAYLFCFGQLMDADGKAFMPAEGEGTYPYVYGPADQPGLRLVGTYELKRKQKLIVRVYGDNSGVGDDISGSYSIKVEGNVSFQTDQREGAPISGGADAKQDDLLPKSGTLRLEMDDGTVQEINLRRVRKATVKP